MKAVLWIMALPVSLLAIEAPVPEPSTYLMLSGGLGALMLLKKFRKK